MKFKIFILLLSTLIFSLVIPSYINNKNSFRIINVVKHDPINTKENININIINIKEDVVRSMIKFNTQIVDKNNNRINPNIIVAPSMWKITNKNNTFVLQKIK